MLFTRWALGLHVSASFKPARVGCRISLLFAWALETGDGPLLCLANN